MTEYPLNKFTITYEADSKLFILRDKDGLWVAQGPNGRRLASLAWSYNAESVCYNYDLGLDEPSK